MRALCGLYAGVMRVVCGWYAGGMRVVCWWYAGGMRVVCVCYAGVFTSRTRERSGAPEYAMVVFAAPQLREYEELRNDPSSFEGRARTDEAVVKTRHPGDCLGPSARGRMDPSLEQLDADAIRKFKDDLRTIRSKTFKESSYVSDDLDGEELITYLTNTLEGQDDGYFAHVASQDPQSFQSGEESN
ncbi:hypothetical protein AURANDRAFT_68615 [Aureococcus anophagefferens]|uniref:Uncharacterized protein n=1 Tax=Aureococcus anophagefferens TaxID=44056 RepID=F0YQ79_AURAN|nr:hypothetical protein AURANDRAFT_68615 [Aureococcus anophagefferens]EGB02731.1 hypothetical protein AURANDRAFT_68615 [Aureococcus anophagefferens]|eukprot:XP_009042571.1 hypothetical protein AURANDRAFT_68615 [Aureococcus anophagefferens]